MSGRLDVGETKVENGCKTSQLRMQYYREPVQCVLQGVYVSYGPAVSAFTPSFTQSAYSVRNARTRTFFANVFSQLFLMCLLL